MKTNGNGDKYTTWTWATFTALVLVALTSAIAYGIGDTAGNSGSGFNQGWANSGAVWKGNPVQVGGINAADGKVYALATDGVGLSAVGADGTGAVSNLQIVGNIAHDSADTSNPIKLGVKATSGWAPTVTADDRANVSGDRYGRIRVEVGGAVDAWYIKHAPSANAQATISKAAGSAIERHVATGFSWSLSSGAGAPTPELITITIRDGATGAGTVMWTETVSLPATAGSSARGSMSGLWLVGSASTALTIETDSAPGANVVANVSLNGVTIPN